MTILDTCNAITGFSIGSAIGTEVTYRLHSGGFWSKQIGTSRFRRANLPVGFTLAMLAARRADEPFKSWIRSVGIGMGVSAVAWAFVDPAAVKTWGS